MNVHVLTPYDLGHADLDATRVYGAKKCAKRAAEGFAKYSGETDCIWRYLPNGGSLVRRADTSHVVAEYRTTKVLVGLVG